MVLDISLEQRDETDYLSLSVPKINDSIEGKIVLEGLFHASIDIAYQHIKGVTGIQVDVEDACDFIQLCKRQFLQKYENSEENFDEAECVEWLLKIREKYQEIRTNE